jgi:hypothetical protein
MRQDVSILSVYLRVCSAPQENGSWRDDDESHHVSENSFVKNLIGEFSILSACYDTPKTLIQQNDSAIDITRRIAAAISCPSRLSGTPAQSREGSSSMTPHSCFIPSSRSSANPEVLNSSIDGVDNNAVVKPFGVIHVIASQLRKLPFPNRPDRKLFMFCLTTWTSKRLRKMIDDRNIMSVLNVIHGLPNEVDQVLCFTLKSRQRVRERRDGCPSTRSSSSKRIRGFNLRVKGNSPPETTAVLAGELRLSELSTDVETAIEWRTAYNGVQLLWEFIEENSMTELASRFTGLSISHQ